MKQNKNLWNLFFLLLGILYWSGCGTTFDKNIQKINREPSIHPDYINVTIPPNIAPMNFQIDEAGKKFKVVITLDSDNYNKQIKIISGNGKIQIPVKSWRNLLQNARDKKVRFQVFSVNEDESVREFKPFFMLVASDSIDSYLTYRLIHPGYYSWSNIKIMQRSLEDFRESSLVENQLIEKNCVNCHSFNKNNPNQFLIHIRGSKGGTYFVDNKKITKTALKIKTMPGGATYPAWHPGGRFVAFSSNQVRQNFYAKAAKSIEVYDLVSTLILYDRKNNTIINVSGPDSINHLHTFPAWSPDGKYLYFCSADHCVTGTDFNINNIQKIQYNLVRKSFNPKTQEFGETEVVFDAAAINKSASFPRISPDGRMLVFTLADYGTFPIWHNEADLYEINLENGKYKNMQINSPQTESYHTWSTNGKWLVFSSKRLDKRSARPFFAYVNANGETGKPFVLPQNDPDYYRNMLESFNIPEFVNGEIAVSPRDFATAANQKALEALPGDPKDTVSRWIKSAPNENRAEIEKGIHE